MTERPTFEQILDVVEGRADDDVRALVEQHGDDPDVRAVTDWAADFLEAAGALPLEAAPAGLRARLGALFPGEPVVLRREHLPLIAVRGGEDSDVPAPIVYVGEDVDVIVHLTEHGETIDISGQVLGVGTLSGSCTVYFGGVGDSVEADSNGRFRIDGAPRDCDRLDFIGPTFHVCVDLRDR